MLKYFTFLIYFSQLCCLVVSAQSVESVSFSEQDIQSYLKWQPNKKPIFCAHRGGAQPLFPENCLETMAHMKNQGADILEVDIRMTKDSVLVLMHDQSLERTTTGTGLLIEKTFAETQKLNLIDNLGSQTPYKIPRLDSILQWAKGKTILSLDVKRGVPFEMVINAVKNTQTENNIIIIVYNTVDLKTVHQLSPDLMISTNIRNFMELEDVINTGIAYANIVAFTGTIASDKSLYDAIHKLGISCIIGTMGNIDKQAEEKGILIYYALLEKGIDIITGDQPVKILEALNQYKK